MYKDRCNFFKLILGEIRKKDVRIIYYERNMNLFCKLCNSKEFWRLLPKRTEIEGYSLEIISLEKSFRKC